MGLYAIKLPDVGEGIAEAELVEWNVAIGDVIREDDVIAAVMTDKATIEIPSVVSGTVVWLAAEVGDTIPIGADLVRLEVAGAGNTSGNAAAETGAPTTATPNNDTAAADSQFAHNVADERSPSSAPPPTMASEQTSSKPAPEPSATVGSAGQGKPLAAPSVRRRARDANVDLRSVAGSGPANRITHEDLDRHLERGARNGAGPARSKNTAVEEIKVIGLRRRIAERMAIANAKIPHITIIEEIDINNLEGLREELNERYEGARPKLTILPFIIKAIVEAVREQPGLNAHFDDEAGVIYQHGGVHAGIATQTPTGLVVPVVHHAEVNSLWENASEILRLSTAARDGSAERTDLSGSTITITSLGPLGAIASTPIINHPEVAIVGINKISIRPWWDGQQFVPRKMMNLSCSFDHRVIDGWDAAVFVQKLKALLEKPAMLFVEH
ncbi:MAG: dihydrolipoamide acetyltransferase family protein [Hyphomicrobiaceae bacterium]